MERVIKFRGKRIDNGEWVTGHYSEGSPSHHYITNPDGSVWVVNPETISQFTERVDKEGKEIYGGDIIRYSWSRGKTKSGECIAAVVWNDLYGYYHLSINETVVNDFAVLNYMKRNGIVIGKVFSNPELLK